MVNDSDNSINQSYLINNLQQFDISKVEAEIYIHLLKGKIMTVRELSQNIPNIQRTYLYNFLDKLSDDWVHINRASKPQTFNPRPPEEILTKKINQKRSILLKQLEDLDHLEKTILPNLLNILNEIHQENSFKQIPTQYKPIITKFFKNNPSIHIEYIHNPPNINPYLKLFFLSCIFHGFFISWNKKPISDEYSIHIYEFERPITKTHLDLANKILELQASDMITLLIEREGIQQIQSIEQNPIKINNFELIQETISYIKADKDYQALLIHPWKLNKNTIVFFYSNKKENGMKFLEWIIKKVK